MKILQSASKIVFIMLAVSGCAGFFLGKLEAKDFMLLAMSSFTFYFANKGDTGSKGATGKDGVPPYAGK